MNWPDIMARVAAGEQLEDILDAEALKDRHAMCDYLASIGRVDLRKEYEARLDAIDLGIDRAQAIWHSISDAQRRVVARMGNVRGNRLVRFTPHKRLPVYDLHERGNPICAQPAVARVATVRNLASRELLEWTGGAFDPEASAIATEKLHFVLRHGPRTDIHNPWTSAPKPVPEP